MAMYSIDDLLHLVHSDGADGLRLRSREPPVVVVDGETEAIEGPPISDAEMELLFQTVANSRQRRELRENGSVQFFYRFRDRVHFLMRAKIENESIVMEIR